MRHRIVLRDAVAGVRPREHRLALANHIAASAAAPAASRRRLLVRRRRATERQQQKRNRHERAKAPVAREPRVFTTLRQPFRTARRRPLCKPEFVPCLRLFAFASVAQPFGTARRPLCSPEFVPCLRLFAFASVAQPFRAALAVHLNSPVAATSGSLRSTSAAA